jgi:putative membrane protein
MTASTLLLVVAGNISAQSIASKTLGASDSAFMKSAASDGIAEVRLGGLALEKSSDASLKKLARQIVDDHTKSNGQLKTLAASKQVEWPAASDAKAQKEEKKLGALSEAQFDKAWTKEMIDAHKKAVKMFTAESRNAKDDDVRKFAQTTLPILQAHLQAATQLAAVPEARDKSMDATMKAFAENPANAAVPASTITPASTAHVVAVPATSAVKAAPAGSATH